MAMYEHRPTRVEAVQATYQFLSDPHKWPPWLVDKMNIREGRWYIDLPFGGSRVCPAGSFIVRKDDGKIFLNTPDDFRANYAIVTERALAKSKA